MLIKNIQIVGVAWFTFHCLMFSIISIISKSLLKQLSVFEILFFQTSFAALIMLPFILTVHKGDAKLENYKMHIVRAVFWVLASAMFFYAVTQIQVARAVSISFAVPLFTTILAVVILKEKLQAPRIVSLILGLIGMLIIIQPGLERFEFASLMVVGAAFLWSVTDIIIKLVSQKQNAFVNTFYFALFSSLFLVPFVLYVWKTPDLYALGMMLLLSVLFIINIYSITKAFEKAELTIMMPFSFTKLVFVAILSYIVFGEVISVSTLLGSAVIISSTSYISYREKKRHDSFLAPEIAVEIFEE